MLSDTPLREFHVIHPGTVRSANDGDFHRITFTQLACLYELDPAAGNVLNADHPPTARLVTRLERDPTVAVRHYRSSLAGRYGKDLQ